MSINSGDKKLDAALNSWLKHDKKQKPKRKMKKDGTINNDPKPSKSGKKCQRKSKDSGTDQDTKKRGETIEKDKGKTSDNAEASSGNDNKKKSSDKDKKKKSTDDEKSSGEDKFTTSTDTDGKTSEDDKNKSSTDTDGQSSKVDENKTAEKDKSKKTSAKEKNKQSTDEERTSGEDKTETTTDTEGKTSEDDKDKTAKNDKTKKSSAKEKNKASTDEEKTSADDKSEESTDTEEMTSEDEEKKTAKKDKTKKSSAKEKNKASTDEEKTSGDDKSEESTDTEEKTSGDDEKKTAKKDKTKKSSAKEKHKASTDEEEASEEEEEEEQEDVEEESDLNEEKLDEEGGKTENEEEEEQTESDEENVEKQKLKDKDKSADEKGKSSGDEKKLMDMKSKSASDLEKGSTTKRRKSSTDMESGAENKKEKSATDMEESSTSKKEKSSSDMEKTDKRRKSSTSMGKSTDDEKQKSSTSMKKSSETKAEKSSSNMKSSTEVDKVAASSSTNQKRSSQDKAIQNTNEDEETMTDPKKTEDKMTRKEVLDDIANEKWDKLKKTMLGRQKFGTAGLRGRMGAGYKCMNDVVVLQTAQGLCSYIQKKCSVTQGVVVGYDGRYNSKRFAELTAKVFVSANIPVHLFSKVCPTPLISFGTILFGAAAGVMVTASHNPKEDNGYKVYWGNGSQIVSPHDDNILDEILQCLDIPDEHWNIEEIRSHPLVKDCQDEVTKKYMEYIRESLPDTVLKENERAGIKTVYSAMHGVGYDYVVEAFKVANLKEPISVKAQQDPNPEFPTVKFPNPEELECVELSKQLAEERGVKLVLINDPDADRLAVAEFDDSSKTWKVFSGNEMGALFGWWLLQQHIASGSTEEVFILASIVSSKMLRAIVKDRGHFVETLTGFKWMGNATLILTKEGKLPLFAFEEAIGYMVNRRVPDKDGVSAAVQVASLASHLYSKGSSLVSQLQSLYKEYGYHVSHNAYYICHDPAIIKKIFRRIRNYHGPGQYPQTVANCEIKFIHDFTANVKVPEKEGNDGHLRVLGTGLDQEYTSGEMIMFRCSNGLNVTVRTSGTEPKLKYYTELVCKADNLKEQEKMKTKLELMVKEFVEELLEPKENGLI